MDSTSSWVATHWICRRNTRPRVWPLGVDRMTIRPWTLVKYLKDDNLRPLFPYISEHEIKDKSKANAFAKATVYIQASWFTSQFLSRLAIGLPVSLLELNTFAHALSALLLYWFWWDKPLDIAEPTVIDTSGSKELRVICALAFAQRNPPVNHLELYLSSLRSLAGIKEWFRAKQQWSWRGYSGISDNLIPASQEDHPRLTVQPGHFKKARVIRSANVNLSSTNEANFPRPLPNESKIIPSSTQISRYFHDKGIPPSSYHFTTSSQAILTLHSGTSIPSTPHTLNPGWLSLEIDDILLERLLLLQPQNIFHLRSPPSPPSPPRHPLAFSDTGGILLPSEPNIIDILMEEPPPDPSLPSSTYDIYRATSPDIILSGLIYGGLHALAWNSSSIHTTSVSIFWKLSCITILTGGIFLIAFYTALEHIPIRMPTEKLDKWFF